MALHASPTAGKHGTWLPVGPAAAEAFRGQQTALSTLHAFSIAGKHSAGRVAQVARQPVSLLGHNTACKQAVPPAAVFGYDDCAMATGATTRLICPLTAGTVEQMRRDMLDAGAAGADCVELRLDYLMTPPTARQLQELLAGLPPWVILTCRPVRQGGRFSGTEAARLELLRQAAALARSSGGPGGGTAVLVDIEMDVPRTDWPEADVILSHHDFQAVPSYLDRVVEQLESSPAAVNKVAFAAHGPQDALRALDVLRACRKPTIALAMGEAGVASRILARKFGALGTFAALRHGGQSAPGQPTIEEFHRLYRWDAIDEQTAVCGVIGCPVGHSMSPAIHNAAFAAAGVNAVYVPLLVQPGMEHFQAFLDALLARPWLGWRGLSVTIPHKENALAYVGPGNCDELARQIGAVNTITIEPDGRLRGDNTDYAAALDALCEAMAIAREGLSGRSVAVLGAGGAARAIVAGLRHYGADVTIYNRTVSRGAALAEEFHCMAEGLDHLDGLGSEIVINCTPLGMHPNVNAGPLDRIPPSAKVVFDTIYNPVQTRLLEQAARAGATAVSGLDMFVRQAASQFETWTGRPAPRAVMRQVVMQRLAAR